jgi:hypothetical protein
VKEGFCHVPVEEVRFYVAGTFALTQLNCLDTFAASSPRISYFTVDKQAGCLPCISVLKELRNGDSA